MSAIQQPQRTWRGSAWDGAKTGVGLTVAYAVVYTLYAFVRLSLSIQGAMPSGDWWQTAAASGITFVVGAIFFTVIASVIAALLGALTMMAIRRLLLSFNQALSPRKAVVIGFLVGIVVWLSLTIILQVLTDSRFTPEFLDTYLFWFGFPGLVYVAASSIVGWRLNALWHRQHNE